MSASIVVIVALLFTTTLRTHAQEAHTVPQSALDAAVQQHVRAGDSRRQDVLRVLAHPEVRAAASAAGLDLRRATSAVAVLDDAELTTVAARASQVEEALAGGSSVTLSTTAIVIGLLVLLVLIVALK